MEENILNKIPKSSGMTVPEGYFADFNKKMAASLPVAEWEQDAAKQPLSMPQPRTKWQIIRPYVYMAAMFMGIWLMMQMFDTLRPSNANMNIESNPVLTAAIQNDAFVEEYFIDSMDESTIMDDVWENDTETTEISE